MGKDFLFGVENNHKAIVLISNPLLASVFNSFELMLFLGWGRGDDCDG